MLAAVRRARIVRCEMRRGTRGLAAVSSTAPLFGILGTVLAIVGSFRIVNGGKEAALAAIFLSLSEAWLPFAYSLALAIAAWLAGRYLRSRVDEFDHQMRIVLNDMMTSLMARG